MEKINKEIFKKLYKPPKDSHKGQNGKLTIVGGSGLFHGASLWALKIASRIVDMVFYSTVPENEKLTRKLKSEVYDFICVPRDKVEDYIEESDAILIGPGLTRDYQLNAKFKMKNTYARSVKDKQPKTQKLNEKDWEENTYKITQYLLAKFPEKKWVVDAGSLQMMEAEWLKELSQVVITPHKKEFYQLFDIKDTLQNSKSEYRNSKQIPISNVQNSKQLNNLTIEQFSNIVRRKAKEYNCAIVLKGPTDIVCSPDECGYNTTGNEGMTKGGTGDVLAGLIAALACKNDLFLAACAGVYINGLAGDKLYKKVGPYFNASDLCDQIPRTMKGLVNSNE